LSNLRVQHRENPQQSPHFAEPRARRASFKSMQRTLFSKGTVQYQRPNPLADEHLNAKITRLQS
jgi:hypothetical protein